MKITITLPDAAAKRLRAGFEQPHNIFANVEQLASVATQKGLEALEAIDFDVAGAVQKSIITAQKGES